MARERKKKHIPSSETFIDMESGNTMNTCLLRAVPRVIAVDDVRLIEWCMEPRLYEFVNVCLNRERCSIWIGCVYGYVMIGKKIGDDAVFCLVSLGWRKT